jgi:hypothetical protein
MFGDGASAQKRLTRRCLGASRAVRDRSRGAQLGQRLREALAQGRPELACPELGHFRTAVRRRPAAASHALSSTPRVGFVSLGCPKALVDSERILTQLRAEGYEVVPTYEAADLVVVNTCGFVDDAVHESLDTIGEALNRNGKVVVLIENFEPSAYLRGLLES